METFAFVRDLIEVVDRVMKLVHAFPESLLTAGQAEVLGIWAVEGRAHAMGLEALEPEWLPIRREQDVKAVVGAILHLVKFHMHMTRIWDVVPLTVIAALVVLQKVLRLQKLHDVRNLLVMGRDELIFLEA
jgi:hypothetical protein